MFYGLLLYFGKQCAFIYALTDKYIIPISHEAIKEYRS